MKLISVNVGLPREVVWKGHTVQTAIFRQPVAGSAAIRKLNLVGDQQADLSVHGGAEKAVYAYPGEHYDYWREQLPDISLSWGAFGENLTTEGLWEDTLCIGDLLSIGSAVLQVTQPRMPCYKLQLRFNRDDMIIAYWTGLAEQGVALVFGPVADPSGSYGIGIVEVEEERVADLTANDPVSTSGRQFKHEAFVMPEVFMSRELRRELAS